uniref:Dynein heavy chain tail domain-containing protein n=1 Tax=Callorhinchus milii TaxID=7868 RepID=A0A4W3H939_CALMI
MVVYQHLTQTLDEFVRKIFTEWTMMVDRESVKRLERPLMVRSSEVRGMLNVNFDPLLLSLFEEIHYWERLSFEIPHYVMDAYLRKEDLRTLRESVLLVVRDYNRILSDLTREQRGLFRERIRFLDKKIQPGLSKLLWSSRAISSYYINDCRLHARQLQLTIDDYKRANVTIAQSSRQISELLLVHIDGKKTYTDHEFKQQQRTHRDAGQKKLLDVHDNILSIMRQTFEVFKNDGSEVRFPPPRFTAWPHTPAAANHSINNNNNNKPHI